MIDIACLAVIGVVVWCVASEGLWGAAHTFLCVLISGLLAMNFFEPLANFLDGMLGGWRSYSDVVALVGLFIGFVFVMRLGTEKLSPTYIQLPATADQVGRWAFAALAGYVTMAFLLTALHTAPLPREFMGFKPERTNFFGMAPDRQWLGFTQYVTEKSFGWVYAQDPNTRDSSGNPMNVKHAFDGKYQVLGDRSAPYPNNIWPSFPIRYATRRDQLSGSGATAAAPVPIQTIPPANTGGGVPGGANPGF